MLICSSCTADTQGKKKKKMGRVPFKQRPKRKLGLFFQWHFSSCLKADTSDVLNLLVTRIALYLNYRRCDPNNCQCVHQNVFGQDSQPAFSVTLQKKKKKQPLHKSLSLIFCQLSEIALLTLSSFCLVSAFYRSLFDMSTNKADQQTENS